MPQSLAKNLVHLIYSTKNRTPWLTASIRKGVYAYMAGILKQWRSPALKIGGVADHVHILFSLSKNHALAKIVEEVKKGASKWLKQQGLEFRQFHWQAGYGAFSVSQSMVETVKAYIENQERHHRRKSFQDEFRAFLKKHEIEFDERYVWDWPICCALSGRRVSIHLLPRALPWAGMLNAFGVKSHGTSETIMTPIPTNPGHQPETEFHGETQVFSGRALAPNDPSLEPRVRKGRPADREKLNGPGNERSPEQDTENLN